MDDGDKTEFMAAARRCLGLVDQIRGERKKLAASSVDNLEVRLEIARLEAALTAAEDARNQRLAALKNRQRMSNC